MDVSRLLKDELVYEVGIRGYVARTGDTVTSLVKKLRQLMRREEEGEELEDRLLPIDVDEEATYIDFKLTEATLLLSRAQDKVDFDMKRAIRIRTLLSHLNKRLNRLYQFIANDDAKKKSLKPLFIALKQCVALFRTLGSEPVYAASTVLTVSMTESTKSSRSQSSSSSSSSSVTTVLDGEDRKKEKETGPQSKGFENQKPPDFHKWGVSFSGSEDKSVLSFIFEVEEKATWKGVPFNNLVLGATEFFTGHAKTWFRSVRSKIDSWEELKVALHKEFLPLNYHETLWEEIRSRKQAKKEPIGEYVANMMALFERLEFLEPVTDERKLTVLKNNLAPFYLSKLALTSILSVEQLKTLGRQLEASRNLMDVYDGKDKPKLVEPEFAAKNPIARKFTPKIAAVEAGTSSAGSSSTSGAPKLKCWDCQEPGHGFTKCPKRSKKLFCHGCGKPGLISSNCPKCKPNRRFGDPKTNSGED